jgi:hypothetical protein
MEGAVKVNDPMKTFEVTTHDAKEAWTNRYELAPSGSGTIVTKTVIWPPLSGAKARRALGDLRALRERPHAKGIGDAQGESRSGRLADVKHKERAEEPHETRPRG